MNRKNVLILIMVALAIALLAYLRPKSKENGARKKEMVKGGGKGPASMVTGVVIQPKKIENKIIVSGTVIANEEVELRPEASGKITRLSFQEGGAVSKGDLLVKINDMDLQAQLSKLEHQKKLLEENEYRQQKLLDIQAVSKAEYDASLNQLNAVKADVQLIKSQIAKTEIRAPFDGTIGLKYVSEGSYISPATTVASLQNINPVKIDFSIPEKYMNMIRVGSDISFTVKGSEGTFKGSVFAIEPKIDVVTRTVQVRAISQNKDGKIFPGSFASVELIMDEINNAIMIPTQALIPELKGQKVFISKGGKAQPIKVEIGVRTASEVQVTKGLQPGDTLITTGIMQLKPDAAVKVRLK